MRGLGHCPVFRHGSVACRAKHEATTGAPDFRHNRQSWRPTCCVCGPVQTVIQRCAATHSARSHDICTHTHTCVCVCMCVCVYMHTYIFIHTHRHLVTCVYDEAREAEERGARCPLLRYPLPDARCLMPAASCALPPHDEHPLTHHLFWRRPPHPFCIERARAHLSLCACILTKHSPIHQGKGAAAGSPEDSSGMVAVVGGLLLISVGIWWFTRRSK